MSEKSKSGGEVYRVLSLDGGGVRGLLTASVLAKLQQQVPFLEHVDVFAGTSTGAILAAGLASGMDIEQCFHFYDSDGERIFKRNIWEKMEHLGELIGSKYDNAELKKIFQEVFGGTTLGDLKRDVIITCFDIGLVTGHWKPRFFTSLNPADHHILLVDALLAATAAPTFFPIYKGFVDGGVAMNDPTLCAVSVIREYKPSVEISQICALSVSTGKQLHKLPAEAFDAAWGALQWIQEERIVNILFDGATELTQFHAKHLLRSKAYRRIDPSLTETVFLDDYKKCHILKESAEKYDISSDLEWLKNEFLDGDFLIVDPSSQDESDEDHIYDEIDRAESGTRRCVIL